MQRKKEDEGRKTGGDGEATAHDGRRRKRKRREKILDHTSYGAWKLTGDYKKEAEDEKKLVMLFETAIRRGIEGETRVLS